MGKGKGSTCERPSLAFASAMAPAGDSQLADLPEKTKLPQAAPEVEIPNLIPLADEYIKHQFNVLLMGEHGTGKTESIENLAKKHGLRLKYYSCSTLDPYTDLVGVPTPRYHCRDCQRFYKEAKEAEGVFYCPKCSKEVDESLRMVRPRELDEADIIFFDELNRADLKTRNAIFEITQKKSINGEPLPHLKMIWGAMNPPNHEHDYDVEEMDKAFEDRFDAYVELKPRPSVQYMSQYIPEPLAKALKECWDDHVKKRQDSESYVSPRRLMKIGLMYDKIGTSRAVTQALPPGGTYDSKKLIQMLQQAKYGDQFSENQLGAAPADFTYTASWLSDKDNQRQVAEYLKQNPKNLETHKKVANIYKGLGGTAIIKGHGRVLSALQPAVLEGLFQSFPEGKRAAMKTTFFELHPWRQNQMHNVAKLLGITPSPLKNNKPKTAASGTPSQHPPKNPNLKTAAPGDIPQIPQPLKNTKLKPHASKKAKKGY